MTAASVERLTIDEARARREQVILRIGDLTDFRRRADAYVLDPRERELLDELEDLDYLLAL